ncbi:hypothetical protein ACFOD4_15430 [Pseudoroseomonas globiformis]|uniref:DUF3606 domain-containing protein n=1 Tax=Teichococcus globiformis TaxID=2307229 RepID=A0ABV7G1A9_9PROT
MAPDQPMIFIADWASRTVNSETCGDGSAGWASKLADWCRDEAVRIGLTPAQLDEAAARLHGSPEDLVGYLRHECGRFR